MCVTMYLSFVIAHLILVEIDNRNYIRMQMSKIAKLNAKYVKFVCTKLNTDRVLREEDMSILNTILFDLDGNILVLVY